MKRKESDIDMAEAILAKGLSRPIDDTPKSGSTNLVTSGGVKAAIDEITVGSSLPEVYIGDETPTDSQSVWFDTSKLNTNTGSAYILEEDLQLYVSSTSNVTNDETVISYTTISEAIKNVPKNLNNHDVIIKVASGNYNEAVSFDNYFGGSIKLIGDETTVTDVTLTNSITVKNSILKISNMNLVISGIYGYDNAIISFEGNAINISGNNTSNGVTLDSGSKFITTDGTVVTVSDVRSAVKANYLSQAYIGILTGTATDGLIAEQGSNISINNNTLTANVVMYSTSSGGKISANAQPTIASY